MVYYDFSTLNIWQYHVISLSLYCQNNNKLLCDMKTKSILSEIMNYAHKLFKSQKETFTLNQV